MRKKGRTEADLSGFTYQQKVCLYLALHYSDELIRIRYEGKMDLCLTLAHDKAEYCIEVTEEKGLKLTHLNKKWLKTLRNFVDNYSGNLKNKKLVLIYDNDLDLESEKRKTTLDFLDWYLEEDREIKSAESAKLVTIIKDKLKDFDEDMRKKLWNNITFEKIIKKNLDKMIKDELKKKGYPFEDVDRDWEDVFIRLFKPLFVNETQTLTFNNMENRLIKLIELSQLKYEAIEKNQINKINISSEVYLDKLENIDILRNTYFSNKAITAYKSYIYHKKVNRYIYWYDKNNELEKTVLNLHKLKYNFSNVALNEEYIEFKTEHLVKETAKLKLRTLYLESYHDGYVEYLSDKNKIKWRK